jgi:transposase-like protein
MFGFWCLAPGGTDGTAGYPAGLRRKVLDLLADSKSVASIAHDLEISDQTVYGWRRQDRIDRDSMVLRETTSSPPQ